MLISGVRVMDPASGRDELADIRIEGELVAEIRSLAQKERLLPKPGEEVIEAKGLVAAPGLVDLHVHFRDPGLTYKEDIVSGASAAAAGGFTTVVCMGNTKPSVWEASTLRDLRERARTLPVHVLNAANVTEEMKGRKLTDMEALARAGAVCFSDDGMPLQDEGLLLEAMKRAAALGLPVSLHEEDALLVGSSGVNAGRIAQGLCLPGAPALAEQVLTARDCLLAKAAGCRVDIQHVSAAGTVDILRFMKQYGCDVVAEVTPQHFTLTEEAILTEGTQAKVNPPLRTEADRLALIGGLKDGTLDMIVTDHAPHADAEKEKPFNEAPSGMIGLETSLALGITSLVIPGHLSLMQLLEKMTVNPAKAFHLDAGELKAGGPADLVLFDPAQKWTVTKDCFRSKSSNSPFIGRELSGRVRYTICRGKTVYTMPAG